MKAPDKSVRQLIRPYLRAGWTVERRGSGHLMMKSPAGKPVVVPSTPSDRRSLLNTKALLRRAERG